MLSRPLLTTHEVAELLKVKEATVRKWIRDGELPAIQFHREWRIAVRHLEEFITARLTSVGAGEPARTQKPAPDRNAVKM
jgi:excisionase family DNA binding protein